MRRNDLDICADILKVAQGGAKKTQIVYKANLNFKIVKRYLNRLIENDMLNPMEEKRLYATTSRGEEFIEQYGSLIKPLRPQ
ncbi:MAG: winged helix-turn-helix domain-containing protein [Candidatus Bathyarchaeota archaeon]|jgi:predicted transcriptional regulator